MKAPSGRFAIDAWRRNIQRNFVRAEDVCAPKRTSAVLRLLFFGSLIRGLGIVFSVIINEKGDAMKLLEKIREAAQRFMFGTTTREIWGAQEQIRRELYRFEEELESEIERLKRELADARRTRLIRFHAEMKLADALAAHPSAREVLEAEEIAADGAADGFDADATLEQACHARGRHPDDVVAKLNTLLGAGPSAPRTLPVVN
jgi:hypothetical protein